MQTSPSNPLRAFTLIELLVVITILTVLISLMLPSLTKARQSATRMQCMSQEKQLGVASHAYVADNRQTYFDSNHLAGASRWTVLLGRNYSHRWSAFLCPTRIGMELITTQDSRAYGGADLWQVDPIPAFPWQRPNYGLNQKLAYYRADKILRPSLTLAFAESRINSLALTHVNSQGFTNVATTASLASFGSTLVSVHDDESSTNILWADGHVNNMKAKTSGSDVYPTYYDADMLGTRYRKVVWNTWNPDGIGDP